MRHTLYSDGNREGIAWVIRSESGDSRQERAHPGAFAGKVGPVGARYIALHTGLFWGIGTFRIKRGDTLEIALDDGVMYGHLALGGEPPCGLARARAAFVGQLVAQRGLDVGYSLNSPQDNPARIGRPGAS